jgi:pyruvate/2-oxoglutarate dehydrogenase complex dihydrolipoamide acyltransferase (E2) component
MADLVSLAWRRNLARAEKLGNTAKAERLRRLLAGRRAEPDAPAEPQAEQEQSPAEAEGLDAVAFASPAARKAADEAGMSAEMFKRRRKSGETGFTKADVERIAAATDDADEGAG